MFLFLPPQSARARTHTRTHAAVSAAVVMSLSKRANQTEVGGNKLRDLSTYWENRGKTKQQTVPITQGRREKAPAFRKCSRVKGIKTSETVGLS